METRPVEMVQRHGPLAVRSALPQFRGVRSGPGCLGFHRVGVDTVLLRVVLSRESVLRFTGDLQSQQVPRP